MAASAIALNVGLLLALVTGLQVPDVLSRRLRFGLVEQPIQAFLMAEPDPVAAVPGSPARPPQPTLPGHPVKSSSRVAPLAPPTLFVSKSNARPPVAGQDNHTPSQTELERLQGIYRTQIAARIARVLEEARLRPWSCLIRLVQTTDGSISEVTVERCTGDQASQQHLLEAIRRAAPLPAPPRVDVFEATLGVRVGHDIRVRLIAHS